MLRISCGPSTGKFDQAWQILNPVFVESIRPSKDELRPQLSTETDKDEERPAQAPPGRGSMIPAVLALGENSAQSLLP